MIELDYIILLILALTLGVLVGQFFGNEQTGKTKTLKPDDPFIKWEKEINTQPHAPTHSPIEDLISHEGVGIVYRPDKMELDKMNEPQAVKEAKEAVAETLRNAKEPEI